MSGRKSTMKSKRVPKRTKTTMNATTPPVNEIKENKPTKRSDANAVSDVHRLQYRLQVRFEQHLMNIMLLCEMAYRDSTYGLKTTRDWIDVTRDSNDEIINEVDSYLQVSGRSSKLKDDQETMKKLKDLLFLLHEVIIQNVYKSFSKSFVSDEERKLREEKRDDLKAKFSDLFCDNVASKSVKTFAKDLISKTKSGSAVELCKRDLLEGFESYIGAVETYNKGVFVLDIGASNPVYEKSLQIGWRSAPFKLAAALARWIETKL